MKTVNDDVSELVELLRDSIRQGAITVEQAATILEVVSRDNTVVWTEAETKMLNEASQDVMKKMAEPVATADQVAESMKVAGMGDLALSVNKVTNKESQGLKPCVSAMDETTAFDEDRRLAELLSRSIAQVDHQKSLVDGEMLFSNYLGMRAYYSQFLPKRTIEFRKPMLTDVDVLVHFSGDVAAWHKTGSDEQRLAFLDEVAWAARAYLRGNQWGKTSTRNRDPEYFLTPVENDVTRYTVGTSKKPVLREEKVDAERKKRLGLKTDDRLIGIKGEAKRLLVQATGLDSMTEGQYVELNSRRLELARRAKALRDELDEVESDLELIGFACDEADQS